MREEDPQARDDLARKARIRSVTGGFPSPAEEHYDGPLNLDEHLIRNRPATFVLRMAGDAMAGAGISSGDELIVDRSLQAGDGSIVVAVAGGDFLVRRLSMYPPRLEAASPDHPDLPIPDDGAGIWGVVTAVIHHV